jgi:NDP-sugar pyrophosphorylase family protein
VIVVIPMAGRGSRFADVGIEVPKPLVSVLGRPMYSWAVDGLPLQLARRLVFVCLAEHLRGFALEDDIMGRYGDRALEVVALDDVTEGQLCTVLAARHVLDPDDSVLVYNADTWCRTGLADRLPGLEATCDGVLGVFEAEGDHWSFARVDDTGRVVETAEKRRISPWATTGLYHFTSVGRFLDEADRMIADDDRTRGEFYVAPLYNRLIAAGADFRIDVAEEVRPMGTPEELAAFEAAPPGS